MGLARLGDLLPEPVDVAWVEFDTGVIERVRVQSTQGEQFAWVVATNVYLKSAEGWRLVAHHASPGSASEPEEIAEAASTLH